MMLFLVVEVPERRSVCRSSAGKAWHVKVVRAARPEELINQRLFLFKRLLLCTHSLTDTHHCPTTTATHAIEQLQDQTQARWRTRTPPSWASANRSSVWRSESFSIGTPEKADDARRRRLPVLPTRPRVPGARQRHHRLLAQAQGGLHHCDACPLSARRCH